LPGTCRHRVVCRIPDASVSRTLASLREQRLLFFSFFSLGDAGVSRSVWVVYISLLRFFSLSGCYWPEEPLRSRFLYPGDSSFFLDIRLIGVLEVFFAENPAAPSLLYTFPPGCEPQQQLTSPTSSPRVSLPDFLRSSPFDTGLRRGRSSRSVALLRPRRTHPRCFHSRFPLQGFSSAGYH